jgi:hypothetical protein
MGARRLIEADGGPGPGSGHQRRSNRSCALVMGARRMIAGPVGLLLWPPGVSQLPNDPPCAGPDPAPGGRSSFGMDARTERNDGGASLDSVRGTGIPPRP